jgi:outer membrane protein
MGAASSLGAQTVELTLAEAIELARRNSPSYLSTRNDEGVAAWQLREAYGGLLPRASVSGGMRYEDGGAALFGSFTAADIGFTETPAYYFSSYSARASLTLSPETWFNLTQQRANRRAVSAEVEAAGATLEAAVKRAYLAVLRARDQVELRGQELARAEENLTLARTRAEAGVAIPLDTKQALIERGRAEVQLLTARSDHEGSKLELVQQLGVEIADEFVLATEFEVFEPQWDRRSLVELALRTHPSLASLTAAVGAQRAAARTAWSAYLPSITASAGLSGFTRQVGNDDFLLAQRTESFANALESCQDWNDLNSRLANPYDPRDCSGFRLTTARLDSLRSAVVASNRAFPFDFAQQPLQLSVSVSLPVFTGFGRQRQVAQAEAAADDMEHELRAERLRLRAEVGAAELRLRTAYQAVQIEAANQELAVEQLDQARERYRVGLDSFIVLTEAETLRSQADQAYLAAVYTFHEALADLEAAVGQPLRPEGR